MLKLAGEGAVAEHIELLRYAPGLKDSGDLEAATRTITATAEATGVGNADYSAALTLPAPSDSRLSLLRIAARLAVTLDSMTAGTLCARVYVDAQDANHRLFDLSWASIGAKLAVVDTHSGNLATIFSLLKDGAAHTFYFFFWVDAGNAVISLCQLWEAVGTTSGTGWGQDVMKLVHTGTIQVSFIASRTGTGLVQLMLWNTTEEVSGAWHYVSWSSAARAEVSPVTDSTPTRLLVAPGIRFKLNGMTVATDLLWLGEVAIFLRSEQ